MKTVKITLGIEIKIPTTPNFILPVKDHHAKMPIHELSDEELGVIADKWKANLIASAIIKRDSAR